MWDLIVSVPDHCLSFYSGCDREINAHFHSAASLKYHALDT